MYANPAMTWLHVKTGNIKLMPLTLTHTLTLIPNPKHRSLSHGYDVPGFDMTPISCDHFYL